jgi:hypothetical protein
MFAVKFTSRLATSVLFAALFLTACASTVFAQEGTVTGRAIDASGGAVPGAAVVLTNPATRVSTETQTNEQGLFSFPSTRPGVYSLAVSLAGFTSSRVDEVRVEIGAQRDVTIELKPAGLEETVTVEGAQTTPLMTTRADRSLVVEPEFVRSIPLNIRNPLLMINSAVGVTPALPTTGNNSASQSATNTFQINGTKATTSDQQIDGAANLVSYLNQVAAIPQVDAVDEFRVVTSAYAPENGRTSGAVVSFSIKSGTSRFHGSAVEFFRDDRFDSNSFDANRAGQPKADLERNQFGFTVGGPISIPKITKNRTFFFAGYEGLRQQQAGSFTATVPTALERAGDFSQTRDVNGNLIVIYDPRTTRLDPAAPAGTVRYIRDAFPGNRIPAEMLSPVARNILQYYPLPNQVGQGQSSTNNFFSPAANVLDIDRLDGRIDHTISDNHRVTFRYDRFQNRIGAPDYYGNPFSPNASPNKIPGISWMARHSWVVSPSLVYVQHFSFGLSQTNRTSPNYGFNPTDLGFASSAVAGAPINVFPVVIANRISQIGNTNGWYERSQNEVWQYLGSASWLRGRHALKAGIDFRKYPGFLWINEPMRVNATSNFTGGPNPQAAAATSGSGIADLLLGAASVSNGIVEREDYNHPYFAFFVQDEFRVTSNLTLTYGLRYNIEPSWSEKQNRLAFIDTASASLIAGQVASLPNLTGGLGFAGQDDNGSRPSVTDKNNVDPRVGAAWAIKDKTVVHGGFGVFTHPGAQYGFERATVGSSRITTSLSTQPDGVTPLFNLANPFPGGLLPVVGTSQGLSSLLGQSIVGVERDQKNSYQISYSADVQRELPGNFVVTAGYVGNVGRNLLTRVNLNQIPDEALALGSQLLQTVPNPFFGVITDPTSPLSRSTVQRGQLLRPYPQFLDVTQSQSALGRSRYNAMQLTLERRFSRGLGTVFAYTLSELKDNVSDITAAVNFGNSFQNLHCQDCDYSNSVQDITHVFRWSVRYDLPFGPGRPYLSSGALSHVLGGWSVASFASWDSGTPIRVSSPNDSSSFGGGVGMRPNLTGESAAVDDRTITDGGIYFNAAAFTRTPAFTFGSAPRTIADVRNPGGRNLDVLVEKRVATGGATTLDIRFELFNALNTVVYAGPGTNITNASFGRIFLTQVNTPRQIQFGARFSF